MLTELHVRDLGVISDLTLQVGPGMTALTGETGAGKTLLVHALGLVLGGRAVPGLVRAGAEEALVEARFEGPGDEGVILARTIPADGRSRAWVDGRMAPLHALADAGAGLVDIHGQHDKQSLLTTSGQRHALDASCGADLAPLVAARRALHDVRARIAALGGDARERARQTDLLRYQIAEIDAARIEDVDEDAALALETARLSDMAAIRASAAEGLVALHGHDGADALDGGASGLLGAAVAALSGRPALGAWEQRLRAAIAEVDDVAGELRAVIETWEDDPARLDEVQARRRVLADLRRKYGETLADVRAFADAANEALSALESAAQEAADLEVRRAGLETAVSDAEAALRQVRVEAAPRLAAAVGERLHALAMPDAVFEVTVGEGAGDAVEFLLSANRGEPAQPLSRVASGGELARTMLALRLVVEGGAPTMLFDEVDAGVGGAAALALGRALREVAATRQVLVVTHLPQVAAFADHQVAVRKGVDGKRTVTAVDVLDGPGRVVELSRMLSGHPDSATARAHAEELLRIGRSPGGAAVSTTGAAVSTTGAGGCD